MTPDEAVLRAKMAIDCGKRLDEFDVMSLCTSVYKQGFNEGQQAAFSELKKFCESKVVATPTEE